MQDKQSTNIEVIDCDGISLSFNQKTNGAGLELRKDFIEVINNLFPNIIFNRAYEWCSGPGFFAYSLLANNIAKTICMSDIYEPSLSLAKKTAIDNNLLNSVTIYHSNNWQNIPSSEKFDLIVGNPPHFNQKNYLNEIMWNHDERIYIDNGWEIHRDFFRGVSNHLTKNGSILLMENVWGSGISTFKDMIVEANLEIKNHIWASSKWDSFGRPIYYIHIKHRE